MSASVNWTRYQKDWNEFSDLDPYWAVLADPSKKHGKWDSQEFYRTGQVEVDKLMEQANKLGYPAQKERALDFGCGLGRLTRALSRYFKRSFGVDISEAMLAKARELNRDFGNCQFVHNPKNDLLAFADNHFDLIYSNIVLQHVPSKKLIRSYITEFVRILKPDGLLVFQLPSHIPLSKKVQPRRRLYSILRTLGLREKFLYWKLGLFPILMNHIPEEEVTKLLKGRGAKVLEILPSPDAGPMIESRRYYITR